MDTETKRQVQSHILSAYGSKSTGAARRRRNSVSYTSDFRTYKPSELAEADASVSSNSRTDHQPGSGKRTQSRRHSLTHHPRVSLSDAKQFINMEERTRQTLREERHRRGMTDPEEATSSDGNSLTNTVVDDADIRKMALERTEDLEFLSLIHRLTDQIIPVYQEETDQQLSEKVKSQQVEHAITDEETQIEKLQKSIRLHQYRNNTLDADYGEIEKTLEGMKNALEEIEEPASAELQKVQREQETVEQELDTVNRYVSETAAHNNADSYPSKSIEPYEGAQASGTQQTRQSTTKMENEGSSTKDLERLLRYEETEKERIESKAENFANELVRDVSRSTLQFNGDTVPKSGQQDGTVDWEDLMNEGERRETETLFENFLDTLMDSLGESSSPGAAADLLLEQEESEMDVAYKRGNDAAYKEIKEYYYTESERLRILREYRTLFNDVEKISSIVKRPQQSNLTRKDIQRLSQSANAMCQSANTLQMTYERMFGRDLHTDAYFHPLY